MRNAKRAVSSAFGDVVVQRTLIGQFRLCNGQSTGKEAEMHQRLCQALAKGLLPRWWYLTLAATLLFGALLLN